MKRSAAAGAIVLGLGLGTAIADGKEDGDLTGALERAGWAARYLPDGTLTLTPAAPEGKVPPRAAPEPAQGHWERLRAQGWGVERTADGSVLLFPPLPAAAAPSRSPPPVGQPWEGLRAQGWGVERDADGAVLLFPPRVQAPAPVSRPGDVQPPQPAPTDAGLAGLAEELEARGWRVEQSPDGSLILYPGSLAAGTAVRHPPRTCAGEVPPAVRDGGIELPVDSPEEARAIVESWLAGVEGPGAVVDSIREVSRVYLIGTVTADEPPVPLHQLLVNGRTGRVIVLQ